MAKTYPYSPKELEEHMQNIASKIFGNRFMVDQTLYEYLIEFLLVFVSAKKEDYSTGKMKFHDSGNEGLKYYVNPMIGLRRFVFYDKARKNNSVKIDEEAYKEHIRLLKENIDGSDDKTKQEFIDGLQDLIHGYSVVLKKRAWCAQRVLPICPEMIFCDAMPNQKNRKNLDWSNDRDIVDTSLTFDKRNFLARGGEVYYLHLLQALENDKHSKERLEFLLSNLLGNGENKLSKICNFIQNSWIFPEDEHYKDYYKEMAISYIPENGYKECGKFAVEELINYLSAELSTINRIEVLAKGVVFQIMRMLSWRVDNYIGEKKQNWIVDMKSEKNDTVKKISAANYRRIEDAFETALNKCATECDINKNDRKTKVDKARKSSLDVFRSKGKDLQCIIPSNGANQRFSLSEDIIRFLVLAMIPPKKKMTLSMFLKKLYKHYGIIIGPDEYRYAIDEGLEFEVSLANSFIENANAFQNFLKATGFLRELSDATSIVVNPYNNISEEDE